MTGIGGIGEGFREGSLREIGNGCDGQSWAVGLRLLRGRELLEYRYLYSFHAPGPCISVDVDRL